MKTWGNSRRANSGGFIEDCTLNKPACGDLPRIDDALDQILGRSSLGDHLRN
jgi:hypothetical protein